MPHNIVMVIGVIEDNKEDNKDVQHTIGKTPELSQTKKEMQPKCNWNAT